MDSTPSPSSNPQDRSIGPAVGIIIIIVIMVVGALYFWGEHQSEVAQTQNIATTTAQNEAYNTSSTTNVNASTTIQVTP